MTRVHGRVQARRIKALLLGAVGVGLLGLVGGLTPLGVAQMGMMDGEPLLFQAVLSTAGEVPPVSAETPHTAFGLAIFRLSADGTRLDYSIMYKGLSGPATLAHIHRGGIGEAGGVVRTLCGKPPAPEAPAQCPGATGVLSGTWTSADSQPLTPELVEVLKNSGLYVNIHTELNGAGELRGQIVPVR